VRQALSNWHKTVADSPLSGRATEPYPGHVVRARDTDACPGALQVHKAADGALVRVRLPGGSITSAQLATLSGVSSEFGSGTLELTARGNV
jgi:sulfite reductase beta subunit-like hemoprotein